jgi:hypothetical protein
MSGNDNHLAGDIREKPENTFNSRRIRGCGGGDYGPTKLLVQVVASWLENATLRVLRSITQTIQPKAENDNARIQAVLHQWRVG